MPLDFGSILGAFPRRLPVFPLPGSVLFPGAVLPLHIFEPRYRQMLADSLASDRMIAMGLLRECSGGEYEGSPPFHETVCVGCILHAERRPDGRSDIALLGVSAGLAGDPRDDQPYRTARIDLLADVVSSGAAIDARLRRAFARTVPGGGEIEGLAAQLREFLPEERVYPALVNTCALTAPVMPLDKLGLLEERDVGRRLDRLLLLLDRPWQFN